MADLVFRLRWVLVVACLGLSVLLFKQGGENIDTLSSKIAALEEPAPNTIVEQSFDSRNDVWFPDSYEGVGAFRQLKADFVSQDVITVGFETDEPWGAFSPKALETVARLTSQIEKIPYVRNVRTLVNYPWIRQQPEGGEDTLVVSDLFENDPGTYSPSERVRRMVAVLGVERTRAIMGEDAVRPLAEAPGVDQLGEPRMVNNVVSRDGRSTSLLVQVLRPKVSEKKLSEVLGEAAQDEHTVNVASELLRATIQNRVAGKVLEIAEAEKAYPIHVSGAPVLERHVNNVGQSDMAFVLVMLVVMGVALSLLLRSVVSSFLALSVVVLAILGTVAFIFGSGDLLNNMTAIAPLLIVVVGVADTVHVLAVHQSLRHQYTDKKELARAALRKTILPVALTSATTAAGFLSLTISEIQPIAVFGYTVAWGTLLAFLYSVALVPAVLAVMPLRKLTPKPSATAQSKAGEAQDTTTAGKLSVWSEKVARWSVARRTKVTVVTAALTLLCVVGALRVQLSSDVRRFFAEGDLAMADMLWFEDRFGGYGDIELVFKSTDVKNEAAAPPLATNIDFLSRLDAFETRVRAETEKPTSPLSHVADVASPLAVLRKMHQVQHGGSSDFYRLPRAEDIPASARLATHETDPFTGDDIVVPGQTASSMVAQYYLQYENGARPSENLSSQITSDGKQLRVSLRVGARPSDDELKGIAYLEQILHSEFPEISGKSQDALATYSITGQQYLYSKVAPVFIETLVSSMGIAVLVITLLIGVAFRSLWLALVSLIPNILPLALPLAAMTVLGLPLDGPTVVVVVIGLGVCVDDTIHFLFHVFANLRNEQTTDESIHSSARTVGPAIFLTSVTLAIGFGVLSQAGFRPNIMTGYLGVAMVVGAWFADMLATPAVLSLLGKRLQVLAHTDASERYHGAPA